MSATHNVEPCDKHEVSNCGLCKVTADLTITAPRREIEFAADGLMTEYTARAMALRLMDEHGITADGWRFGFDNGKRRFGCCRFGPKMITLSRHLTVLNGEAQVRNTVLHEIAHALAGHAAGHGPQWQRVARSIGCDAKRCYDADEVVSPAGSIQGTCPACGYVIHRHRMPKAAGSNWHGKCPQGAHMVPRQYLVWRRVGG